MEYILTRYNKNNFKGLYYQHWKFREDSEEPLTLNAGYGFTQIFFRTPIIFYGDSDKCWVYT